MFARAYRFSFRNKVPGKIISTPFFVVRYGNSENGLKCAVVVGKKVSKKATERNRIKRKIIALIKELFPVDAKIEIVIYAKKGLNEENFKEASVKLEEVIDKLK